MKHITKRFVLFTIILSIILVGFLTQSIEFDMYEASIEASYIILGFIGLRIFHELKMSLPLIGWMFIFSSFIVDFLDEFENLFIMHPFITEYYEELGFLIGLLILIVGLYFEIIYREQERDNM